MQSPEPANLLDAGAQVKVIGVAEENLYSQLLENILRNSFDRCECTDGHENRSFDFTVRGEQASGACVPGVSLDLKLERHREIVATTEPHTLKLHTSRFTISEHSCPFIKSSRPTVMGSRKRRGPALPGLK